MSIVFGIDTLCDCHQPVHIAGSDGCRVMPKAHARSTDPETSHEAARSLSSERIRQSQQIVLDALKERGPMTDDRLWLHVRGSLSPSGARTRRSELVALGLVVDTGRTEVLLSGRRAIVWAAK